MIDRIKSMFALSSHIKELQERVGGLSSKLDMLSNRSEEMVTNSRKMADARDSLAIAHSRLTTEVQAQKVRMDELLQAFDREIKSFGEVKRQLAQQLGAALETEIKNQLSRSLAELNARVGDLQEAKSQIDSLGVQAQKVQDDIVRIREAAETVSEKDFELAKTFKQLRFSGDEKAELLLKIDRLERLVSKMRQRQQARY